MCEVTFWLGWWLSTCGEFQEHLPDEVRGNFERLMLSRSKALEFLGGQGITALGNLVLSRRDSLLLDVRSTVPAGEVACLRYSDLSSSSGLFPTPLLDSALPKMCAASNDALVQRTLHPPKIPRKSLAGPVKAGSSSTVVASRSQSQESSTQQGWMRRGHKGKAPFSSVFGGSGRYRGKRKGVGKKVLMTGSVLCCRWGGGGGLPVSALEALAGYWCRILGDLCPEGWLPHPLQGLSSSPRSLPDIVSRRIGQGLLGHWPYARRLRRCCPRMPWRSSSIWVPASTAVFSWCKR